MVQIAGGCCVIFKFIIQAVKNLLARGPGHSSSRPGNRSCFCLIESYAAAWQLEKIWCPLAYYDIPHCGAAAVRLPRHAGGEVGSGPSQSVDVLWWSSRCRCQVGRAEFRPRPALPRSVGLGATLGQHVRTRQKPSTCANKDRFVALPLRTRSLKEAIKSNKIRACKAEI
jgi:hypothetical protein